MIYDDGIKYLAWVCTPGPEKGQNQQKVACAIMCGIESLGG